MYLFNRSLVIARGQAAGAGAFALEACKRVTAVTGIEFSVFNAVFGKPIGTLSWSARVGSLEEFQVATDKLVGDEGYQKMLGESAHLFEAGANDIFAQVVSATVDAPPHGWYSVTEATMDMGHALAGIEFGVSMQAYIESTYDVSTGFLVDAFNQMGTVAWTIGFDSPERFDALSTAILADEKYHRMVSEASGAFITGSGTRSLLQRIG